MTAPAVSVVVATRDRPAALERCLTALTWQTERSLEIVVVDDASADSAAVVAVVASVLDAADRPPATRVVQGPGRGPATARNLGARAAAGVVVCFTDDDCVALPRWAQQLAAACASGAAAAGVTVADPAAGRAAVAAQLLTHALQVASLDAATGNLGFAPTCNLACHAQILRRLPFDESCPLGAGEDRDWCARLAAEGVVLRFVPKARVEHRPQLGLSGLVRQQLRYGRGAGRCPAAGGGRRLSGAAFYRRIARDALAAGPATAAIVAIAQGAVTAGALLEPSAPRRR
jgi:glycosyltransferase involved in cell wall biosynthesis